jgi:hypothetical protein
LIAAVFDLSIAANMSLAISMVGWLQASDHIVTRLHIDPVINTDVHHYAADGIALVLPHITRSWRRVFEMRETRIGGGGPPGSDPMFATREHVRPTVEGVDRLWRTQEPKRLEGCSKVV